MQIFLIKEYANLIKEYAKMKRLYPNTVSTFRVKDSSGYLFWMKYKDIRRELFLEDLNDPEFINNWLDMYRDTNGRNPEVTKNLIENVTGGVQSWNDC